MTTGTGILEYAYKVVGDAGIVLGSYRFATFLGYAEVTTTTATSLPIYLLPQTKQQQDATRTQLVLSQSELGDFCITYVGFRLPSGLVATNSDALKLSDALANTGAISATAASSTIAAGVSTLAADFVNNGTFSSSVLGKKTSDVTPAIRSIVAATPTSAGSGVSVASGTKRIPVIISVAFNKGVTAFPYEADINSYLPASIES